MSMEQMNNLETLNTSVSKGGWGIDKKIPVALIFVVILQTLGFTWGAATLSNDVKNNGEAIAKLEKVVEKLSDRLESEMDDTVNRRELDAAINRIDNLENRILDVERNLPPKRK